LSFTPFTAFTKLLQAILGSFVSVKYVHGGENLDGFLTALVLTPLAVADTPESLPSGLNLRVSPSHSTIVRVGLESVLHPLRPAEVAAWFVGTSLKTSAAAAGSIGPMSEVERVWRNRRRR
jgi:hypothetical protein